MAGPIVLGGPMGCAPPRPPESRTPLQTWASPLLLRAVSSLPPETLTQGIWGHVFTWGGQIRSLCPPVQWVFSLAQRHFCLHSQNTHRWKETGELTSPLLPRLLMISRPSKYEKLSHSPDYLPRHLLATISLKGIVEDLSN